MKRVSLVMEKFWLALAIISLLVVIYIFIVDGLNRNNVQYLIFPVLAGAMYGFRSFFRKRMEKNDD
ncbi:MAG TPA: hypothetical protein VJ911_07545 [Cryomorphaceae bacterium]|nr:hypothetical protein [Cryomorphaceae bacterium]